MKKVMQKSLTKDLKKTIDILQLREKGDREELRKLSDHTIGDVALYKNLDAVSLAVLIYSLYKVYHCLSDENHDLLLKSLLKAYDDISSGNLGSYNQNLKKAFSIVKKCNAAVKTHVGDVFEAAKLKKGSTLVGHGLSVARAANVMGLTRWELLSYTGGLKQDLGEHEKVKASDRLQKALDLFEKKQSPCIFFDAGPIITLTLSRLVWLLPLLQKKFGVVFYITPAVYGELVENPSSIKKFQFESLEVQKLMREGVLVIYDTFSKTKVEKLTKHSNKLYASDKKWLEVVQAGEMESVIAVLKEKVPLIMDERTMRLLIENCKSLRTLLERRSRKKVAQHEENLNSFHEIVKDVSIIRSTELVCVAFKHGLLDEYLPKKPNAKNILLDAALWNVKSNGSAVTAHEIEELKDTLLSKK